MTETERKRDRKKVRECTFVGEEVDKKEKLASVRVCRKDSPKYIRMFPQNAMTFMVHQDDGRKGESGRERSGKDGKRNEEKWRRTVRGGKDDGDKKMKRGG